MYNCSKLYPVDYFWLQHKSLSYGAQIKNFISLGSKWNFALDI